MTRLASRERVQPVPTLLTRAVGSFNTTNNASWYIKAHLMYQEALPKGDIYTTTVRTQGKVYKALLTAMKRYEKYIALEKERESGVHS